MTQLALPFTPSAELRTRIGRSAHLLGMTGAALLLAYGIWLALLWQDHYGALALLSGFCYATTVYLIGRSLRRLIDRRHSDKPVADERRQRR